jgi:putative flippase GtrA
VNLRRSELLRYVGNGVLATGVHYLVLFVGIEYIKFRSAGVANLFASTFGISASFIGNRYFVFKNTNEKVFIQAFKFIGLYTAIGFIHGFTLFIWSDLYKKDYKFGFIIAVTIQFILGYIASKKFIFNKIYETN